MNIIFHVFQLKQSVGKVAVKKFSKRADLLTDC